MQEVSVIQPSFESHIPSLFTHCNDTTSEQATRFTIKGTRGVAMQHGWENTRSPARLMLLVSVHVPKSVDL